MHRRRSLARTAALAVPAAALAVAGCGSVHGGGSSTSSAPAAPASKAAPVSPSVNPGGPISPSVAGTPSGGKPVAVVISGLPGQPALTPGGPALTFMVTLQNHSGTAYHDVTPVVSMGHCTCTGTPIALAPEGTLAERDPATGNWRRVRYNPEGGGTDFLLVVQQPGISLPAGGSASFTFRVSFTRQQRETLKPGTTAIDVTVVQLPGHTPVGAPVPSATVPVAVQP
ncbi:MAG: hypothetical protein ACM32E_23155 [Gemmatimonadota bacterium]